VAAASVAPLDARAVAYIDHNQFAHSDNTVTLKTVRKRTGTRFYFDQKIIPS